MNDKQEGQGELILKDGSRYIGMFRNGVKCGKGKLTWPDTSYYEGEFSNNKYEGYGIYVARGGKMYKGEWKEGRMDGFGVFFWPDGKKYLGYYKGDKRNGFGVYMGKNGNKYEGKFLNGKQHGIGRVTDDTLVPQLGLYQKGKKIKCLNIKTFYEDIDNIDQEVEKINSIINTVEFFKNDDEDNLLHLDIGKGESENSNE